VETNVIVKRLLALVKPYKSRAALALLSMAITAATQPLLAKAMQLLFDRGFEERVSFSLWLIPVVLVSIFVLRGIGTFGTAYFNNWVLSRVLNDMRARAPSC
jgi:subfamily B ATP-binding cassette protein MsbA